MRAAAALSLCFLFALSACKSKTSDAPDDPREACARSNPLRDVYFGDLHVHTSYSFDAWVFDVLTLPPDAYQFAKGETLRLPPLGADGQGTRTVKLDRPLDFAAVTDHSEYFGEVDLCKVPGTEAYDSDHCLDYRGASFDPIVDFGAQLTFDPPSRFRDVCGTNDTRCLERADTIWERIQADAEAAYDRTSACSFTSFVAYEYTAATNASNLHRNVIFRNAVVPQTAASYFEFPKPQGLWSYLKASCLDANNGCDVISIPHNSNISNGNMFHVEYPGASNLDEEREQARFRAEIEPLFEIYQHKGDSECRNGLSGIMGAEDELCDFEKLRPNVSDCGDTPGAGALGGIGCASRLDFLRGVLVEGLKEEQRLGVNPYEFGVLATTDSHNATPGEVRESGYPGHWGSREDTIEKRLRRQALMLDGIVFSGGGLTAVWAEENSRNSLFDAMKRKEVYGTSGPRIVLRAFGGWGYGDDLCSDEEMVKKGYDGGVPMGGRLGAPPSAAAKPKFIVSALADPGTENLAGTPLQVVQVVKGWLDNTGQAHLEVFDVAGDRNNGATVNTDTCETSGAGASSLCTVWTDANFDASQPAFYYVRAVENPVCRWSRAECLTIPEAERPEGCSDPSIPSTVQERAWSSPFWYTP